MTNKKYILLIVAAALIVAGGVLLVHAQAAQNQTMGRGWKGHHGMFLRQMARYLDLSDAQKTQIKTLFQQQRPAMQPLWQQLAADRKDMLAATASGAFDQAKVSAIATREAQARAQLQVMRLELQSKIFNTVLNSEQKMKVDQMRQKMAERITNRMQSQTDPRQ